MQRKFSIRGAQAVASPTDTVLGLTAVTTVQAAIYKAIFGSTAAPADNALQWLLQRYTAAGTATAVTPQKLNPVFTAALCSAGENHTVEPTYTAGEVLFDLPLNQRASFPAYFEDGCELVLPATAANGIGVQPVHASFTGSVECCLHYKE